MGVADDRGVPFGVDHALANAPSVLFDAVAVALGPRGAGRPLEDAQTQAWLKDAYIHLKPIVQGPKGGDLACLVPRGWLRGHVRCMQLTDR
jgi:hypothetical protein